MTKIITKLALFGFCIVVAFICGLLLGATKWESKTEKSLSQKYVQTVEDTIFAIENNREKELVQNIRSIISTVHQGHANRVDFILQSEHFSKESNP